MLIWCPTPLPEDSATALLTRMLIPTPYQVSAEGRESREPRGDTRPEDELDAVFGETETLLPRGKGVEEALHGKKRAASEDQEGKPPKNGKTPSSGGLGRANDVVVELDDEDSELDELDAAELDDEDSELDELDAAELDDEDSELDELDAAELDDEDSELDELDASSLVPTKITSSTG